MSEAFDSTLNENMDNAQPDEAQGKLDIAFVTCPCCGKPTLPKPLNPNPALVDHWLACMVTGTPFSHAYPIYGGKLTVTVTRLTNAEADLLDQFTSTLELLRTKEWPTPGCPVNLELLLSVVRRLVSVKEIRLSGAPGVTFTPQAAVLGWAKKFVEAKSTLLGGSDLPAATEMLVACYKDLTNPAIVSAVPDEMLLAVLSTHVSVNNILMNAGFDPNFWKGIELA